MGQIKVVNPGGENDHKLAHALNYLMNSPAGADLFWKMYNLDRDVHLVFIQEGVNGQSTSYTSYDAGLGLTDVVRWDPKAALLVNQANGVVGAQSPALGLAHEFIHFLNRIPTNYGEYVTTQRESDIASALGEPIRPTYSHAIKTFTVTNTTASSKGIEWIARDAGGYFIKGPAFNYGASFVQVSNTSEAGAGGGYENMWWEPVYASGADIFITPKTPGGYWNPYIYPEVVTPPSDTESLYTIVQESIGSQSSSGYAETSSSEPQHSVTELVELIGSSHPTI